MNKVVLTARSSEPVPGEVEECRVPVGDPAFGARELGDGFAEQALKLVRGLWAAPADFLGRAGGLDLHKQHALLKDDDPVDRPLALRGRADLNFRHDSASQLAQVVADVALERGAEVVVCGPRSWLRRWCRLRTCRGFGRGSARRRVCPGDVSGVGVPSL